MAPQRKDHSTESSHAAAHDPEGGAVARQLEGLSHQPPARDEARLLPQSPRVLFFFWSFARDPRETLRRALGAAGGRLQLAVRLVNLAGDEVVTYAAAPGGQSIWFEARPAHAYRAEVGFFAEGAPFVRLLSSNVVRTAPDSPSQVSDEEPGFRTTARDFAQMLAASGFAEPASESAGSTAELAAADDSPPNSSTLARRSHSSFTLGAGSRRENL
ncbi:MAG: DUF4912 domain-containing protein [Acidobacteria bacterium]|nr:DUF4912 domain-containing protein [Acidobacteriota bacterium]